MAIVVKEKGMGIPFVKTLSKMALDKGIKAGQEFLKGLADKTDLDGDGKLDIKEEIPELSNQLREGAEHIIECADTAKLAKAVALGTEAFAVLKDAIDFEKAKAGFTQVQTAGMELLKLGALLWTKLILKDAEGKEATT